MAKQLNYVETKRDLPPYILKALKLPKKARINIIIKGIWVEYPLANELIEFLDRLDNQTRRPRMMGRTIVGPTGIGKTSIIQKFILIKLNRQKKEKDSQYEYLYVTAPTTPSVKALYIRILSACNFDVRGGTSEQLWQKVLQGLRDLKVRMLFIDELHDLLTAQNDRILAQCRNALKDLSNHLQIPVILIGTEKAEKVLKGDKQILSRYPVIHLDKWKNNKDFKLLLHAFEIGLPLQKASNLDKKEIANRIYELSEGILGDIAVIITECAIEAIIRGSEKITLELINELHEAPFSRF